FLDLKIRFRREFKKMKAKHTAVVVHNLGLGILILVHTMNLNKLGGSHKRGFVLSHVSTESSMQSWIPKLGKLQAVVVFIIQNEEWMFRVDRRILHANKMQIPKIFVAITFKQELGEPQRGVQLHSQRITRPGNQLFIT
ncbi:hypothetical protein ACJX0J_038497, partial [Zea mays]